MTTAEGRILEVERHGITSRFDMSPWDDTPSLYRPFLRGEFYEQRFLDHIRELGLRGVYIDAGSCLGTHTVWFSLYCPSTYVHAFDPRSRCARWTEMNVQANGLEDKVTVHPVGLSADEGTAQLRLDGVDETFAVQRLDRVVRAGFLDSRRPSRRVVVIKADVEGMEALVLRGAKRILRWHRPVVFAEAFTEQERKGVEAVLEPYGYRPTGRVFNSTPTYEFVPVESPTMARVRRVARRLPKPVRKVLIAVRAAAAPVTRLVRRSS